MFLLALPLAGLAQSATPAGTTIQNSASITFSNGSATPVTITSNVVSATVTAPASSSALTILRTTAATGTATVVGPTQCQSANGFATLPPPTLTAGRIIDLSQPVVLAATSSLHGGEAAFLRLTDADQNLDATVIDVAQ